jgi:hypothetical protein
MTRNLMKLLLAGAMFVGLWQHAAAQDVDPGDMVRGGLQVIQMIDQNKVGEIWDGAAPAARKRVTRADFGTQVGKARSPLGAAQQRTWVAINRQVVADADPDLAGQYVSVEYETRFANRPNATVRELVSFHLDRDQTWRFSGYVLR